MTGVVNVVILSWKTRLRFLWIAASHGFGLPGALLGAGGPGEERAHGCGGGEPAVCVGRLHGEKHTPMSADLTSMFKFCCKYCNRHHCRGNSGRKKIPQLNQLAVKHSTVLLLNVHTFVIMNVTLTIRGKNTKQYKLSIYCIICQALFFKTYFLLLKTMFIYTVSCWWRGFSTQRWNLGVWLESRCVVSMLNRSFACCSMKERVKKTKHNSNLYSICANVLFIYPHFYLYFFFFEGRFFIWRGTHLRPCLGPAAAHWMDTCTYLEAVMTMARPIWWDW